MQKYFSWSLGLAVLSGLMTFVAVNEVNFVLGWICFIPLFVVVIRSEAKDCLIAGFVFGCTVSLFSFYWMIPGAEKFTGSNILYGFVVFLISAFFFSSYCACLLYTIARLRWGVGNKKALFINTVLAAAVFVAGEFLLTFVSAGFPWFDFHSGHAIAGNIYAIQPAAYFGGHVLTFVVVLVNYLAAHLVVMRAWKKLLIPVSVMVIYLIAGYYILDNFEKQNNPGRPLNIAILAENIPPDIKWDDNTGDLLVKRLLDLNRQATALKPDVALWSESAIPWTYRKDDDLVNEVLKITAPANITHVMGINTAVQGNEVYNSAYCILPSGEVVGRYDKQFLLSLIEKPLGGMLIPFFSSKGFSVKNDSSHNAPLNTPFGKAGVMICNESILPAAASRMSARGAEYILNMSNDGWFDGTYLVGLHFVNARLRAVETRKDVAINCNNGISGLVAASGRIEAEQQNTDPYVQLVTVHPNDILTLFSSYPSLFLYFCFVFIGAILVFHGLARKR